MFSPEHQDYQNERNVNWQYDADGNLTDTGSTQFSNYVQYTVDAAGRNSRTVSVAIDSYHDPDSTVWGSSADLTQSFDGDGQKVKKVASDTTIDYTEGNTTTTTTTYLVRSSVLNQVLTELSETGQKQRTFVYLGSAVLAWQRQSTDNSQAVLWEHRDPSNASYRVTTSGGGLAISGLSAELDPLGNDAGLSNSIPNPQHKQTWSYPGFGSTGMSGDSQCMLDGTFEPCDFVFRAAAAGGLQSLEVPSSFSGSVGNGTPVKVDDPPTYDPPTTDPNNPQPNGIVTIYEHYHYEWVPTGDVTTSIQQRQPQNTRTYDPCTAVNAEMDSSGDGYYTYEDAGWLKYGQANVVAVFQQFASDWNITHPNNPIGVGDLSQFGGAANRARHPAGGHPGGVIIDMRPMRNDNVRGPTNFNAATYSLDLTTQLIQGLSALADVVSILFNDPNIQNNKLIREQDRFDPRTGRRLARVHDNHLHVTFRSAARCPVNLNNIHP